MFHIYATIFCEFIKEFVALMQWGLIVDPT
jgi:hypothetical protein